MDYQRFDDRSSTAFKRYKKWLTPLFVSLAILAAVSGAMIVVLIGASVTMRYLAYAPFRFTEELVGLLMTAAFFLALPLVTLRAKHVRVLILVSCLPHHISRWVSILAGFFGFVFCLWFFALYLPWLEFAFDRTIKTEVGRLLMYPWMALLPLSMLLTGLAFLLRGLTASNRAT
ncbi:MAG: TRAP transporter small permease [Paracoccaceae bacterium]|nr:TRAP transporter small permease [Paracoccaceae bacterium]